MTELPFLFILFIGIIGFFLFMYFVPVGLWITAIFAGVKVTIGELIGMRIRPWRYRELPYHGHKSRSTSNYPRIGNALPRWRQRPKRYSGADFC
jgi:SigmaW regulon antibacterial